MLICTHCSKVVALRRKNRGVSLIEVLVSIVIASIGLLALAGINASSVRYTKMSQYRGTATQLANDIGERMRANKAGFLAYDVQSDFATQSTLPSAGKACYDPVNAYSITCTAAELAAYDVQTWQVLVRNQLPEGSIFIVAQGLQSAADIWVVWRDPAVAEDELTTAAGECPAGLTVAADPSVRCSYFRINL